LITSTLSNMIHIMMKNENEDEINKHEIMIMKFSTYIMYND